MPVASTLDLCTASNVATPGLWHLRVRSGVPSLCGNGVAEGAEECDGADTPVGETCESDCTLVVPAPDGTSCEADDDCDSGHCAGGVCCNLACDAEQCQTCVAAEGAIADGVCTNLTGAACDDGDACTPVDSCEAGLCVGTGAPSCAPAGECLEAATCDPGTGECSEPPPAPDGTPCDGGACVEGACVPDSSQGGNGAGAADQGGAGNEGGSANGGSADGDSGGAGSTGGCDCTLASTEPRGWMVPALALLVAGAVRRRRVTSSGRPSRSALE